MNKSDQKIATTSGVMSSGLICKIQNMPWLKRNITASAHPKSNEKTEDKMVNPLPEKEKDKQYAPEKKEKKKQRKPKKPSTDVPPNNSVKSNGNAKSKAEGQNNRQAEKRDIHAPEYSLVMGKPENVWNPDKNAAESLFPNVDSKVTEINEEALMEKVIKESMKTAFLEKCAMDPPQDEVAEKSAKEPEFEDEWGKVQSNLPTPEPETDLKISDRNNNSGLVPIENLMIPAVKLEKRIFGQSTDTKDKNNYVETPLVPAIIPKYIDKYGRIDGITEKRLFMGKGARFKEQEYINQLQLKTSNLLSEPQISRSNSSETSSDISNALAQVSSQEDHDSVASFKNPNETLINVIDEAYGYSEDLTQTEKEFISQSHIINNDSRYSVESADQILSEIDAISNSSQLAEPAIPLKNSSLSSGEVSGSSHNDYVLPTLHSNIETKQFVNSSGAFSDKNLKQDQDSSRQNSGSQIKRNPYISEQTSGQTKKNLYISEQISTQSHQNSTRFGRPIVAGANSNNYQQKTYQGPGIAVNRGGYHDGNTGDRNFNKPREFQGPYDRTSKFEQNCGRTYGRGNRNDSRKSQGDLNNDRNPRYEQNPHKYNEQNRRYQNGSRVDNNYSKWDGEPKRDYQKGQRGNNYNPHYWVRDQKRDFNSGPKVDQISQKFDDQNRDLNEKSKSDCSSSNENRKLPTTDINRHSQIEKTPSISLQESNVNASSKEKLHVSPKDVATNDFQQSFENVTIRNESKDFNDTSNISEVPDISNFVSRFSVPPPPIQHFRTDINSVAPTNSFSPHSIAPTPHYSEINDVAGLKDNLPCPTSNFTAPPGFQTLDCPTMTSCPCKTPVISFEERYANLLLTDPLLFRLLQQSLLIKSCATIESPTNVENTNDNPNNRKLYGTCPNCNCNSQLSTNFNQKTTNLNVKTCHSEEEERAQSQLSQHLLKPSPINAYSQNPVVPQHSETLQISHVENAECTASNMRHPHIPSHENMPYVLWFRDPDGNVFPVNYDYQRVQPGINLQPQIEEGPLLPPPSHNLPFKVQKMMLAEQNKNASGYPTQPSIGIYGQHGMQMQRPFASNQYDPNITMINRTNVVHNNSDGYRETNYHRTVGSMGVDLNNQNGTNETVKAVPLGKGATKKSTFVQLPSKGRGQARVPKKNGN